MSLASMLVHVVTVHRQSAGAGVTKTWAEVATNVPVMIQPLDPASQEAEGSSFGKDYKAFFRLTQDIREGDRITDQDGQKYVVKGIKRRNYGSTDNQHLEALVSRDGSKA